MKICFCNILYSKTGERGGLGSHIQDMSAEISQLGHDVTIITSGEKKEFLEQNVRIVQIGKVHRFFSKWQILNPVYVVQRILYMINLVIVVLRGRFDLVEAADGGGEHFFLTMFRPCTIITKLHGNFRSIYKNRFLAPLVEFLEAFAARRSDGIYTSSFAYAKRISKDYEIPLERIQIIPYGIRVQELLNTGNASPAEKQSSAIKKVMLSVGSSPVRKGAMPFLHAAFALQEKPLQFILECSDPNFLSQYKISENVTISGNIERSRFHLLLSDSDVVVFPSQFESFSITTYEAMLLGKIIIISGNVPLEGSANLYPRKVLLEQVSGENLARCILDIVEEKITFPPLNESLQEKMKSEYDVRTVAESTLAFFRLIHASRTAPAVGKRRSTVEDISV